MGSISRVLCALVSGELAGALAAKGKLLVGGVLDEASPTADGAMTSTLERGEELSGVRDPASLKWFDNNVEDDDIGERVFVDDD